MVVFPKNKTLILLSSIIFSTTAHADGARRGMFAGFSTSYQNITTTSSYSGVSYGLLLGKDFALGQNLGMKAYFSLHTASLSSSAGRATITSPALGLGLNYAAMSCAAVASYDASASGSIMDQNLGLKGEVFYSLLNKNEFQFQIGGDVGAGVFLLKSASTYGLNMRMIWTLGR